MNIIKARKKPIEIECVLYKGKENRQNIIDWSNGHCYYVRFGRGSSFKCTTLEGDMNISEGDYVIRGIKGEYYSCKPDIFELTYEVVGEKNWNSKEWIKERT